jgi:hypothetical protein
MDSDCPFCHGELETLGVLGDLAWYRCINCGAEFAFDAEEEEE